MIIFVPIFQVKAILIVFELAMLLQKKTGNDGIVSCIDPTVDILNCSVYIDRCSFTDSL